jgi:RNA recognition motif-containing protein
MSVRLFVGNLPYDATEDEIRQHFIRRQSFYVSIPLDRETGRNAVAFVEFRTPNRRRKQSGSSIISRSKAALPLSTGTRP